MIDHDFTEHLMEWVSGGLTIGTIFGVLPLILAVPAAVFYCLRIIDWFEARKEKRHLDN